MNGIAEIIINKPIHQVWDFLANVENMAKWGKGTSESRLTSSGPIGIGSTIAGKYSYRNRTSDLAYEVTEFQPPHRQAIRSTSGPFPFSSVIELETAQGGTRVVNIIDAGSDSKVTTVIFTLFGPFIHMMMNRQVKKELRVLKSVVEAEDAQATAPPAQATGVVAEAALEEAAPSNVEEPATKTAAARRKPAASRAKAITTGTVRKPKAAPKRTSSTARPARTRKAPPKETD